LHVIGMDYSFNLDLSKFTSGVALMTAISEA
jgi:hypothetical protein